MFPRVALFAEQQKQQDATHVVEPDELHQKREAAAESRDKQPAEAAGVNEADDGRCTEDREEQVVPGGTGAG